ncbi:MAG: hypothetical protein CM15mP74_10390 [Halieaceae bacterium]|nr:MAG: hypothetical protein CM15mP74_10390 [Halieaceae bacterium]
MNPAMAEEAAALSAQLERWSAAYFETISHWFLMPTMTLQCAGCRKLKRSVPNSNPRIPTHAWVQRRCPPLRQWRIGDLCCLWITPSRLTT